MIQTIIIFNIFALNTNTDMKKEHINRLKVVLVEKEKTGKWLSEQLGKDPSTVSKWCSNKIQPSLEMLDKIAILLGVDRRELLNKSNKNG
jgi:putative transcriptional regulator